MTHFKLLTQIERDLKNQVLFDSYRRPTRRTRLMLHLRDRLPLYVAMSGFVLAWLLVLSMAVRAEQCPNPGEKCKVITLTEQEENVLAGKNGILDTAAQARSLDLNGFVTYFKQKLAAAPAGEVKKDESKPGEKSDQPVDKK